MKKIQKILLLVLMLAFVILLSSCRSKEAVSLTDAKINESGELVLHYSDGKEQNLGVVVGKDGTDGKDGADGKDGETVSSESIVINGEDSEASLASAKALRSSVSIVSNFQTSVYQGGWYPGGGQTTTRDYTASGSGVIYKMDKAEGDAFIITNYHVVYDASSNTENGISNNIDVYLYGSEIEEKAIDATYVGGSLYYDIAVLRVENSEILKESSACEVSVFDSNNVVVGDSAIAIGNAQGYGVSVSLGIVSVDSEYITMISADGKTEVSFRVMRVDAAVNSGNSGGGLFNGNGDLIGIVNAKIVYDGVENIGYAIPSKVAVSIAENIIDYCYGTDEERVQRALLGITISATDSKAVYDTETGKIKIEETVSVYEVAEGSLAKGMLQTGDVLLSATLNGETVDISRQYHVIDMMLDVRAGDTITFSVLRNDEEKTITIVITEECLTEY